LPYTYLDNLTTADVAFRATGNTPEEMFISAAQATMAVMVPDLESIENLQTRWIQLKDDALDMLLFQFLQELIFFKDAESLLLKVESVKIEQIENQYTLNAEICGEAANPDKHELVVDVKAVTLHKFQVAQTPDGWQAVVILDI